MFARRLYRDNKRINRHLKQEAYKNWFKRVFLGNMIRWTYWHDRPKLVEALKRFQEADPLHLVIEVMNMNSA